VISWPSWSANESNARAGVNSRTVYSSTDQVLFPYMGPWATGCEVTAVGGPVLIIEWERGSEVWREKRLARNETYVINLVGTENSAMIESWDGAPPYFTVTLKNCNPQPIQK
jgi:hypothetical protein